MTVSGDVVSVEPMAVDLVTGGTDNEAEMPLITLRKDRVTVDMTSRKHVSVGIRNLRLPAPLKKQRAA